MGANIVTVTIRTLCENTAAIKGVLGEWGWSVIVETQESTIMLDTGASGIVIKNAEKMNVDLSKTDVLILSHGHNDHTGGLQDVLTHIPGVRIICHPEIWEAKYKNRNNNMDYLGLMVSKDFVESTSNVTLSTGPVMIDRDCLFSGSIPMTVNYEFSGDEFLIKDNGGSFRKDYLNDDAALIVKTDKGLVVVTGCAHRGIVNTLIHARKITGEDRIYGVIGGTHLYSKDSKTIDTTVKDLLSMDIKRIGVSHCTGFYGEMKLAEAFRDRFFQNHAGMVTVFD
jgi:Metal-dependent hydrolases of the beta-lactamase superfamily II